MFKLKVGDNVKITAGKDKGRDGQIEKIYPKNNKVVIPGLNIYKKHVKGFQGQKGGIYEIPRPIDIFKIALICPKCKKPTRVGFKFIEKEKVRICKKCGKEITVKKS
jgi:large subunit ribosomal protein L24